MAGLVAVPAQASFTEIYVSGDSYLYYYAAAGETNDVTVGYTGSAFTITDPGATTLDVGDGCSESGGTVTCDSAGVTYVYFTLYDGNDSLTSTVPIPTYVNAGDGNDTVTTGTSNDSVYPGTGVNTVHTGDGNDYVSAGTGDDAVNTGPGNDTIYPGLGDDDVVGGAGTDTVSYGSRTGNLSISLNNGAGDGDAALGENDNVHSDIENVYTGTGNDTVTGNAADNYFSTNNGDDTLTGVAGRDTLSGGLGDDVVNGGDGSDYLYDDGGADDVNGDAGDDSISSYSDTTGSDDVSGGPGVDQIFFWGYLDVTVSLDGSANDGRPGDSTDNVRADVEDVSTGEGNDKITGSKAANELLGGEGDDTINGKKGSDGIDGGRGADHVNGGPGVDSLLGGAGADKLKSQDRSADYVTCGGSVDSVNRDGRDDVMADCEKLT